MSDSPEDSFVGQVIQGRYRVIQKLGHGGMGAVYLAEQVNISRNVALKVLRKDLSTDDEFVKRFRQEARLAASLNHRRVTTIFDFDRSDDGSLFLAMEYVEGKTLSEIIRHGGALAVSRAVRLAIQTAEGLEAAHQAGIIHRDIKPQNIMVTAQDDVKLMDFGIARLRDVENTQLTRTGVVMGTPAYMAPEQFEGGEVDERTDLYAFGVMLYEMLTGVKPFNGTTAMEIFTKKAREAPPSPRLLRKDVPAALAALIMRTLARTREDRPRNMKEVLEDLHRAVDGTAMEDVPTVISTADETVESIQSERTPKQRQRVAVGVLAVVAAVVVAIMASWATLSKPPRSVPSDNQPQSPSPATSTLPSGSREQAPTAPTAVAVDRPSPSDSDATSQTSGGQRGPSAPPRTAVPGRTPSDAGARSETAAAQRATTGSAPATASTSPAERSDMPAIDPARLRALVEDGLRANGLLKTASDLPGVSVEVSADRVVTLSGVLSDQDQRATSLRIAKTVPGVKDVKQRINIKNDWEPSPSK